MSISLTADGVLHSMNVTSDIAAGVRLHETAEFDLLRPPNGACFFEHEGHAYLNWLAHQQHKENKSHLSPSRIGQHTVEKQWIFDSEAQRESDTFQAIDGIEIRMPRLSEVPRADWDAFKNYVKTTPDVALMLKNYSGDPAVMRSLFQTTERIKDRQQRTLLSHRDVEARGDEIWFSKILKTIENNPAVQAVVNHPKAQPIVHHVQNATDKVGMLKNAGAAFDAIKDLLDCFQTVDDEKYHVDFLLKFLADRKGQPLGDLMGDFTDTFVTPAVDQMVQEVSDNVDISKFADMFKDSNGTFTREKAVELLDMMYGVIEDFAKLPLWEPFGCVEDHVIQPGWEMVKPKFVDLIVEMVLKLQAMWDQQVMTVVNFVAGRIATVVEFSKTPTGGGGFVAIRTGNDWSVNSASGYVHKHVNQFCRDKSKNLTKLLGQYTQIVVANMGNSTSGDSGYNNLHTILAMSALDSGKELGKKVLMNWMQDMTIMVTDKIITPALEAARDLILTILANAKSTMVGLCGLIPEVGAAVCALLTSAMTAAETAVSSGLVHLAKKAILNVLKDITGKSGVIIDWAYEKLESKAGPGMDTKMAAVGKMADALKPVLDAIMPIAEAFLPVLREKLEECDETFQAVDELLKVTNTFEETIRARNAEDDTRQVAHAAQAKATQQAANARGDGTSNYPGNYGYGANGNPNDCLDPSDPCNLTR